MLQWPNLDGCYATVPTIRDTDPVDTSGDGQNWADVLAQSSPVVTDSVVRRAGRHTGLDQPLFNRVQDYCTFQDNLYFFISRYRKKQLFR